MGEQRGDLTEVSGPNRALGNCPQPRGLGLEWRSCKRGGSLQPRLSLVVAEKIPAYSRKEAVRERGQELARANIDVVKTERSLSSLLDGAELGNNELAIDLKSSGREPIVLAQGRRNSRQECDPPIPEPCYARQRAPIRQYHQP